MEASQECNKFCQNKNLSVDSSYPMLGVCVWLLQIASFETALKQVEKELLDTTKLLDIADPDGLLDPDSSKVNSQTDGTRSSTGDKQQDVENRPSLTMSTKVFFLSWIVCGARQCLDIGKMWIALDAYYHFVTQTTCVMSVVGFRVNASSTTSEDFTGEA